jgi:hypothetical protein
VGSIPITRSKIQSHQFLNVDTAPPLESQAVSARIAAVSPQDNEAARRCGTNPLAEERAARAWCRKEKLRREPLAGITQQDRLWT